MDFTTAPAITPRAVDSIVFLPLNFAIIRENSKVRIARLIKFF